MRGANEGSLAVKRAVNVHQAAVIDGSADFSSGVEHIADFVGQHGRRYISVFDGEGATKTATLLDVLNRLQLEATYLLEKANWYVAQMQTAHGMTTGVIGNLVRKGCAYVFDAQLANEKLGELVDPRKESFYLRSEFRIAIHFGGLPVVVAHHRDARG
jgi:hypothetical protein